MKMSNSATKNGFKPMKTKKAIKKLKRGEPIQIVSGASTFKTGYIWAKKAEFVQLDLIKDDRGNIRTIDGHLVITKDEYESLKPKKIEKFREDGTYPFIKQDPIDLNCSMFY